MDDHPADATNRVHEIKQSDLSDYVQSVLTEFQKATSNRINHPTQVYIVGSVLTSSFVPNKSDIDLVVVIEDAPDGSFTENFQRYWENGHSTATILSDQIRVQFTKVDICNIYSENAVGEKLDNPYHRIV